MSALLSLALTFCMKRYPRPRLFGRSAATHWGSCWAALCGWLQVVWFAFGWRKGRGRAMDKVSTLQSPQAYARVRARIRRCTDPLPALALCLLPVRLLEANYAFGLPRTLFDTRSIPLDIPSHVFCVPPLPPATQSQRALALDESVVSSSSLPCGARKSARLGSAMPRARRELQRRCITSEEMAVLSRRI